MNTEQAKELLQRYRMGQCNEAEKAAVESWYALLAEKGQWEWTTAEKEAFNQMLQIRIAREIEDTPDVSIAPRARLGFLHYAAAAIILFVSGVAVFMLFPRKEIPKPPLVKVSASSPSDIAPGIDGAILTLASGEKIVLDSSGSKTLAVQSDVSIINRNGQIIYENKNGISAADNAGSEVAYNTISTPRARQFKIQLSDGTMVWLNAASSIRYPAKFPADSRTVEVSGEAYFEVASIPGTTATKKIPFFVKIISASGEDGGSVQVTGTHFDINAYEDEAVIKATLLEGSITFKKGSSEKQLIPNQQAQLNKKGTINVLKNMNAATEIAWKNGYFTYNKADIQSVMKQLSRWYDIEVDYENGQVPDDKYWGDIERDASLSTVLKILEMSGVRFRVEGRKVTVIKAAHEKV